MCSKAGFLLSVPMKTPPALEQLIAALRVLPGVGPKSAQRMAYHLLQRDQAGAARLAQSLRHALDHLLHCQSCNTFSETEICSLCADSSRRQDRLCVVEMPADMAVMEATRCYDGLYFVLMGRVSPLDGQGAAALPLEALLQRALNGQVQELILATNFTAEGEATAHVIAEILKETPLQLTRMARGLPSGGELEFVDAGTLAQAFYERRVV